MILRSGRVLSGEPYVPRRRRRRAAAEQQQEAAEQLQDDQIPQHHDLQHQQQLLQQQQMLLQQQQQQLHVQQTEMQQQQQQLQLQQTEVQQQQQQLQLQQTEIQQQQQQLYLQQKQVQEQQLQQQRQLQHLLLQLKQQLLPGMNIQQDLEPHPLVVGPDRHSPTPGLNTVAEELATKPSEPCGSPPPSAHLQQNSSLGNADEGSLSFSLQMLMSQELNLSAAAALLQGSLFHETAASVVQQQETVDLFQTNSSAENYSRLSPEQTRPISLTCNINQPVLEQTSARNCSIIDSSTSTSAVRNTSETSVSMPLNAEMRLDSDIGGNTNFVPIAEASLSFPSTSTIADSSKLKTADLPGNISLMEESISVTAQAPVIATSSPPPEKVVTSVQKEGSVSKTAEDRAEKISTLVIPSTSNISTQSKREAATSSSLAKQTDDALSIPSQASKDCTPSIHSPSKGEKTKQTNSILENHVEVNSAVTGGQAPQTATSLTTPVVVVSTVTTTNDCSIGLGHAASAASPWVQEKSSEQKSLIAEEDSVSKGNAKPRHKRKSDNPCRLFKMPRIGVQKNPSFEQLIPEEDPVSGNAKPRHKRKSSIPRRVLQTLGEGDEGKNSESESEDPILAAGIPERKMKLTAEESSSCIINIDQEAATVVNDRQDDNSSNSDLLTVFVTEQSDNNSKPEVRNAFPELEIEQLKLLARIEEAEDLEDLVKLVRASPNSIEVFPTIESVDSFINIEPTALSKTKRVSANKTHSRRLKGSRLASEFAFKPSLTSTPKKTKKSGKRQAEESTLSSSQQEKKKKTKRLNPFHQGSSFDVPLLSEKNLDKSTIPTRAKPTSEIKTGDRSKGSSNVTSMPSKKKFGKRQADESPSSSGQQRKKMKQVKAFHQGSGFDVPNLCEKNVDKSTIPTGAKPSSEIKTGDKSKGSRNVTSMPSKKKFGKRQADEMMKHFKSFHGCSGTNIPFVCQKNLDKSTYPTATNPADECRSSRQQQEEAKHTKPHGDSEISSCNIGSKGISPAAFYKKNKE